MSELKAVAENFIQALSANSADKYAEILAEDVSLLSNRWTGMDIYRKQFRVVKRLMDEWSAWPDPSIDLLSVMAEGDRVALEFRIQATEHDRYVKHHRSAYLKIADGKIIQIRLYCPEPIPSGRRKGWIMPADMSPAELSREFEAMRNTGDPYEWIGPNQAGITTLRGGLGGNGDPHPGSNGVGGIRWSAEEADRKIDETIEHFRRRNIGFSWWVGPHDTPIDLRDRLEKHGLMLAGDAVTMARIGLNATDIPNNPDLKIEVLDGHDLDAIDANNEIIRICFNWPLEQLAKHKLRMIERLNDERFRAGEAYFLARIKGQPVAQAYLNLESGIAYLGGAGVLPEFRQQKIYSTLLRYRLEYAHERGLHVAAIDAEPLSRPIVERYGFKELSRSYIYGWMPVIDPDVIKSLVPQ